MRTSNSRDKNALRTAHNNRNAATQIRKPISTLENTNLNVALSSRKSDRKQALPPKPQSKVSYDVEVNMTESKIFQAKQGLQLLKKKMNRTGMSRQKSHSTTDKLDENTLQPLMVKKLQSSQEPKRQPDFKKAREPTYSRRNQAPNTEAIEPRRQIPTRPNKNPLRNQHDEKPIAKQVDFMDLLEREMQKESEVQRRDGPKVKKEVNKIYNEKGEQIILHECTMGCGRMFNPDTIEKHEKICHKVFQSKRKAFDSSQHRQIQGETYKHPNSKQIEEKPKPKTEVPKWKVESARLRAGLKLGKNQALSKEEEKVMQAEVDVLKPCPFCGRKFNDKAAEKHIPFCERKSKEIAKNAFGRQR